MDISSAPSQTPGRLPRSESAPRATATLSGTQRDALYALIMAGFGALSELENATMIDDDLETCYRLGRRVTDTLRLIVDGGLGWGETLGRDAVSLMLPADELRRILSQIRRDAIGFQEGMRDEYEDKRDEWETGKLAQSACTDALEQLTAARRSDTEEGVA